MKIDIASSLSAAAILHPAPVDWNTRPTGTFPVPGVYLRHFAADLDTGRRGEHDEHVMDMNEVRRCASRQVQRAASKVGP
jgi:hypothetical protein